MALSKLQFKPGVNREGTNYTNEGGWYACDKVRFRSGFPEKIGGWARTTTETVVGTCRTMWNWITLAGSNLIGVGTTSKYYVYTGGSYNDVTPERVFVSSGTYTQVASVTVTVTVVAHGVQTGDTVVLWFTSGTAPSGEYTATRTGADTFTVTSATSTSTSGNVTLRQTHVLLGTDPFATTNASTTVVVTHVTHGAITGDYVTFSGATGFNNIPAAELNAEHLITFLTGNTYSITVTTAANASSSGGGALVTAVYDYTSGLDANVVGVGWGVNPWDDSGTSWGESVTAGPGGILRLWSNDNFGQNLVAAVVYGPMFYWEVVALYVYNRMTYLVDASFAAGYAGQFVPYTVGGVISSDVEQITIAFGANSYDPTDPETTFDPMLVRWADQSNVLDWVPTATNQAGEQRLTVGSQIISFAQARQEILIWTDAALYSMQYVGPPYVYGFTVMAEHVSCIAPNAVVIANNTAMWMGNNKFFIYSGRVETMSCTVRRHVFDNINTEQLGKIVSGTNEEFNEAWWFYPSAGSTENDSYVTYNYVEDLWYYGSLARTAWLDSALQQYPLAMDDGVLLEHENGVDDNATGVPAAIDAYIQSSDFDIGDGNNYMFIWRTIPDIDFTNSTVGTAPSATLSLYPRTFPGAAYGTAASPTVTGATYPLTTYTNELMTRLRARQMSLRVESNTVGTMWQLGAVRIDARPDGRKV